MTGIKSDSDFYHLKHPIFPFICADGFRYIDCHDAGKHLMSVRLNFQNPSTLRILQYVVYGSVVLYFGRELFIPLSFATLVSFILYPVCTWMERKGIGRLTAIVINVTLLMILLIAVLALLVSQLSGFLHEWPSLQVKLLDAFRALGNFIADTYGVTRERQQQWLSQVIDQSGSNIMTFVGATISASAFSAVLAILVPIYVVLILYYRHLWMQIVYRLFPRERRENIREMLSLTIQAYYNFIKGMALVYLIVGILNSTGLLLLGVPHAILFGFIASVLTFIPYIGIMVGSLLPITMAWVTYDSIWYPAGVVGVFVLVQYLEANVIFPLAVSNRLNVNTLVVLTAIFLGGILWGMAGMILFIPFVAIIKLIADHNPKLKTLSMILGQPG